MAHYVEPMDLDSIDSDFDNKENSFRHNNVLQCTEKGYEELDVSELNMKLRYSITPAASPMSKSYTHCVDNRNVDSDDSLNCMLNENNLTRSLNTTLTKNDSVNKFKSLPLQSLPKDQFVDGSINVLKNQNLDSTITTGNITVTISGDDDTNLLFPSASSSSVQTPEASSPTKDTPKGDGGSPIMRGLKSVLNIFRASTSPIPPTEGESNTLKTPGVRPADASSVKDKKNENHNVAMSTPIAAHRNIESGSRKSSPLKESIVFNDEIEKELQWKDETTILFSQEKIPIHKLFFQQSKLSPDKTKHDFDYNLNSTVEYMDISYNGSQINRTLVDAVESDGEFVDCETTFNKTQSPVKEIIVNQQDVVNNNKSFRVTNITMEHLVQQANNVFLNITVPVDSNSYDVLAATNNNVTSENVTPEVSKVPLNVTVPIESISVQSTNTVSKEAHEFITSTDIVTTGNISDVLDFQNDSITTTEVSLDSIEAKQDFSIHPVEAYKVTGELALPEPLALPNIPIVEQGNEILDMTKTIEEEVVLSPIIPEINPDSLATNYELDSLETNLIVKDPTQENFNITNLIKTEEDFCKQIQFEDYIDYVSSGSNSLVPESITETLCEPMQHNDKTAKVNLVEQPSKELPADIPLPDDDDLDKELNVINNDLQNVTYNEVDSTKMSIVEQVQDTITTLEEPTSMGNLMCHSDTFNLDFDTTIDIPSAIDLNYSDLSQIMNDIDSIIRSDDLIKGTYKEVYETQQIAEDIEKQEVTMGINENVVQLKALPDILNHTATSTNLENAKTSIQLQIVDQKKVASEIVVKHEIDSEIEANPEILPYQACRDKNEKYIGIADDSNIESVSLGNEPLNLPVNNYIVVKNDRLTENDEGLNLINRETNSIDKNMNVPIIVPINTTDETNKKNDQVINENVSSKITTKNLKKKELENENDQNKTMPSELSSENLQKCKNDRPELIIFNQIVEHVKNTIEVEHVVDKMEESEMQVDLSYSHTEVIKQCVSSESNDNKNGQTAKTMQLEEVNTCIFTESNENKNEQNEEAIATMKHEEVKQCLHSEKNGNKNEQNIESVKTMQYEEVNNCVFSEINESKNQQNVEAVETVKHKEVKQCVNSEKNYNKNEQNIESVVTVKHNNNKTCEVNQIDLSMNKTQPLSENHIKNNQNELNHNDTKKKDEDEKISIDKTKIGTSSKTSTESIETSTKKNENLPKDVVQEDVKIIGLIYTQFVKESLIVDNVELERAHELFPTEEQDTIQIRNKEIENIDEEIIVSENNSPYVSVSANLDIASAAQPRNQENFEEVDDPFATKTKIEIPLPISPAIVSKGYNFNFDEMDDPFATKTKVRQSPPSESKTSETVPFKKKEENIMKKEEKSMPKKDFNKNRRMSQPERKKPINKRKLNATFDNIIEIKSPVQHVADITITKDTRIDEPLITKTSDKVDVDAITLPSEEIATGDKAFNIKDNVIITPKEPIKLENNEENASNTENQPKQPNESITGNKTLSSKQSTYYSAGISSSDSIISRNVFNIPEIDDMNFNPFATKTKVWQSPPPSLDLDSPFANRNKIGSSPNTSIIADDVNTSTNVTEAETHIDKIDSEPMEKESLNISTATCSSKTTEDKDTTVREIHTEDEDTIEGPFLETDDNVDRISNFDDENADMMHFNDMPVQGQESSETGEMFIDAEAFKFLLNQNKGNMVADSGKESLFLKFDPLFAKRISSDGVFAALSKIQKRQSTPRKFTKSKKDSTLAMSGPSNLNSTYEAEARSGPEVTSEEQNITVSKPMMVVTPAVNPVPLPRKSLTPTRTNRRSLTFTSPAMAVIDRLLSMSANNSLLDQEEVVQVSHEQHEADFALAQLRELLAEKELDVYNLRVQSKELKDRLSTLEMQMKTLETESQERLRKVNELNETLAEKSKINKSMAAVVEEYERTIASLIADTEQDKKQHAKERIQLINERDEQTAHLASMEISFNDLHSKYEKSKQVIMTYKANEDAYKKSLNEFEQNLTKMQKNYELLKQHATSKLNQANQELEKMNRTHEAEVLKLNAMIKRKEMHITSLEETLTQKTKANEELTAICDELINKVG